jgi:hypothetical protein
MPLGLVVRAGCKLSSAIRHEESGGTVLPGPLADEVALHGVLMKIRDLGLPLLEVKRVHKRMNRIERKAQA